MDDTVCCVGDWDEHKLILRRISSEENMYRTAERINGGIISGGGEVGKGR